MNISFSEIVLILAVALLLFGPEQLPSIARQLGKLVADLRKGTNAIRREFYNSVYQPTQELTRDLRVQGQQLRSLRADVLAPPSSTASQPKTEDARTQSPAETLSSAPNGDAV